MGMCFLIGWDLLRLTRIEFGSWEDKFAVIAERVVRTPTAGKPKLLDQVRDVIHRKHYSIRTEQA
jgi:hypothetical protein